jgi:peptidoglycan/xylan/chitin deacetylase (PgdA/CDA1 family)
MELTGSCALVATEDDERALLSAEDIARLGGHPLIEVGAHTVDHPILAQASLDVQREQIARSLRDLREWTAQPVRSFAYPNGLPGRDFTPQTVCLVRDLGCDFAFTTQPRLAAHDGDALTCPRFTMLEGISEAHLAQYLSWSWQRSAA